MLSPLDLSRLSSRDCANRVGGLRGGREPGGSSGELKGVEGSLDRFRVLALEEVSSHTKEALSVGQGERIERIEGAERASLI